MGEGVKIGHILTGGGHKNLTFADGGEGEGVQNGLKNADIINERPLSQVFSCFLSTD